MAAAEAAFPAWKATPPNKRRDMLNKFADLIDGHAKQLGELTRITLGAPWGSFGLFEVRFCAEMLRYHAGWTDKFAGEAYPQEDGSRGQESAVGSGSDLRISCATFSGVPASRW